MKSLEKGWSGMIADPSIEKTVKEPAAEAEIEKEPEVGAVVSFDAVVVALDVFVAPPSCLDALGAPGAGDQMVAPMVVDADGGTVGEDRGDFDRFRDVQETDRACAREFGVVAGVGVGAHIVIVC